MPSSVSTTRAFEGDPNSYIDETNDSNEAHETNEAKRRRIARVSGGLTEHGARACYSDLEYGLTMAGLRHVPKEEDQVRRHYAVLHALSQIQDEMCLYTG